MPVSLYEAEARLRTAANRESRRAVRDAVNVYIRAVDRQVHHANQLHALVLDVAELIDNGEIRAARQRIHAHTTETT